MPNFLYSLWNFNLERRVTPSLDASRSVGVWQ